MFDFLKSKGEAPGDIKSIRHQLVLFLKDELRKAEGGEGGQIRGLQLFLAPAPQDKSLYEAAVYLGEPNRFRDEEVQRIADDYAIDLPEHWTLELVFTDTLPESAARSSVVPAALFLVTSRHGAVEKPSEAMIKVLHGQAEQEQYRISSKSGRVCIGRDREVQGADGFLRVNQIAFPSTGGQDTNRYVSRQHAHIQWNAEDSTFYLFADDGGIPPRNKIKVQTKNGEQVRLQTTEIGYQLKDGDQIILGGTVLLEFRYLEIHHLKPDRPLS